MANTSNRNTRALASIGIDIGRDIFHLVGFDLDGKIVLRRKIKRLALVSELEKLPLCIVGMEACLSAHFVSRAVRKLGYEPRISSTCKPCTGSDRGWSRDERRRSIRSVLS